MACKSISIIAITENLKTHIKSKTLDSPTSNEAIIKQSANELLEKFLQSMPDIAIRRIGVKVSGLTRSSGQTDISAFLH